MALPASPPLSLSAVCAEFGAPANTPLASFLRGGPWVPNTPANAGVPTSLPISLTSLLGASSGGGGGGGSVNLDDHGLVSTRATGIASVGYQFNAAGTVTWTQAPGGSGTYSGEWLLSGSASAFEVRVTCSGFAALVGITDNVWQNAAANWSATVTSGPVPELVVDQLIVEIRPAGGGSVLTTGIIDMEAERV